MNVCERTRTIKVREEEYDVPCGSRYCACCGMRWQGDQRVCAVAAAQALDGGVALITVTAPGRREIRRIAQKQGLSYRDALLWWNNTARARWRLLHLRASRKIRRRADEVPEGWRLLMRSWEYQKRGALHIHLVLPYETPAERAMTTAYLIALWNWARHYSFGYVLGGDKDEEPGWVRRPRIAPADGPAAARYVAKYVASTGAGKEGMVAVAQRTAQRGSVLYVSRWLTSRTGVTMTALRSRRRVATRYPGANESRTRWEAACVVDAMQRGRPPLTPEAVATLRSICAIAGVVGWVDLADGVVEPATRAAVPLTAVEDRVPYAGAERLVAVALAPVLLRDPDPGPLGPTRTDLVRVEVINL